MKRRIAVVGGGIAGLSAAWSLARQSDVRVVLFEREPFLCSQASGHNAAMFRPLESDGALARLASRSRELFAELCPTSLVDDRGLLLLHEAREALVPIESGAREAAVRCQLLEPAELARLAPGLRLARRYFGLYSDSGGVIDIHALAERLTQACRRMGVELRVGYGVNALKRKQERVTGVELGDGQHADVDDVVLTAGAWCNQLARSVGSPLELVPVRRHLALLETTRPLDEQLPAVWRLGDEVYFRREGARVLASPCDETPWHAPALQSDLGLLAPLSPKLSSVDREFGQAKLVRYWACLRTFSPDRRPVIGRDPRVVGLHWLAGLGGFGMTTGVAAGERLARALLSQEPDAEFAAERFSSSLPERHAAGDAT